MKVTTQIFSIEKLFSLKNRIDPKPQYQRTPVWKIDRKKLLIDSIFKGYDLPKFYLNDLKGNSFFDFEVCDGQQRLRTIFEFIEGKFKTGKGLEFDNEFLENMTFDMLPSKAQQYFNSFKLSIALIKEAKHDEIRDLFARLQKGMGLNQAELRRALSSHIGTYVESIVENHTFFKNCGFPNIRNKHQDYIDHVIAFMINEFKFDFKGQSLKDIYLNITPTQATEYIKKVAFVLDELNKLNTQLKGAFRNKWAFVDTFILICQQNELNKKINSKSFIFAFNEFEIKRKANRSYPRKLIESKSITAEDKRLYEYITCFAKDGSLKENMKKRNSVFTEQFKKHFN